MNKIYNKNIAYAGIILTAILALLFCLCLFLGCTSQRATGDPEAIKVSESWPQQGLEAGYIDVPDGKLIYRLYGKDKTGIPIICLHGGPGGQCDSMWNQIALAKDRPILFYNQLGGANSHYNQEIDNADKAKSIMTIEHFCNELDLVIKHFSFDEYILFGGSWGTMLATEYAGRYNPGGLKAMILSGPFLNVNQWTSDAERLIKSLDGGEAMWETVQVCIRNNDYDNPEYLKINQIYTENFTCRNKEAKAGVPTEETYQPFGAENAPYNYMWGPSEFSCTGTLKGHDSTQWLKNITAPILYVCGEYDSGTPQAAYTYNSKSINGEVCVLPSCAHGSYYERPSEFNCVVEQFLDRALDKLQ